MHIMHVIVMQSTKLSIAILPKSVETEPRIEKDFAIHCSYCISYLSRYRTGDNGIGKSNCKETDITPKISVLQRACRLSLCTSSIYIVRCPVHVSTAIA